MTLSKGQNPNHPKLGDQTKVEPIRTKTGIKRIRKLLAGRPRDLCLFTLGINTAYRASELLSLRAGQVRHLEAGQVLEIKQRKTKKYRKVTLNKACIAAIRDLLDSRPYEDGAPLFMGQRGPLQIPTVSTMVKHWCRDAGLKGNYGSHSLRKTWGYWQRVERKTPVPLLMAAFGHATQQQTLAYLGIQEEEIQDIFAFEL